MAIESYLIGLSGFVVYVVLFIMLQYIQISIGWFVLEILLGILIHLLCSVAGFLWLQGFEFWYHTSVYAFLWFCFFFVSSIYSVSASVGIIDYLFQLPNYVASLDVIFQQCVVTPFKERAEFLVATKQACKIEQSYLITETGKQTVDCINLVLKILGMESKGFYTEVPGLIEKRSEIKHKPIS